MYQPIANAQIGDDVTYVRYGTRKFATVIRTTATRVVVGRNGVEMESFMKDSGSMVGSKFTTGYLVTKEEMAAELEAQHKEQCFYKARNELRDVIVTKANMHLVMDFLAKLDAFDEEQAAKGEAR